MKSELELSACQLFAGVGEAALSHICASPLLRRERYENGGIICDRGSRFRALGVIVRGGAVVSREGENGGEPVLLNRFGAGMVFGFASVFTGGEEYVYGTRITAAGKTTVLWLPEPLLTEAMRIDLALAVNIMGAQAEKIRLLNRKVAAFTASDAVEKLMLYLEEWGAADGTVTVDSMSALARRLDMGRASLYRAAEKLQAEGKLLWEGKRLRLLCQETGDHKEETS